MVEWRVEEEGAAGQARIGAGSFTLLSPGSTHICSGIDAQTFLVCLSVAAQQLLHKLVFGVQWAQQQLQLWCAMGTTATAAQAGLWCAMGTTPRLG